MWSLFETVTDIRKHCSDIYPSNITYTTAPDVP